MTEPPPSPPAGQERVRHALDLAGRHLARRDRTEQEIRRHLEARGIETLVVEAAVDELRLLGYVDDAGFAARFAEDRRLLDGWGAERIERRLRQLGIDVDVAAAAAAARSRDDEAAAALALLERRFPALGGDPRDHERAYAVLVRKGFEPELAGDVVRAHERAVASS